MKEKYGIFPMHRHRVDRRALRGLCKQLEVRRGERVSRPSKIDIQLLRMYVMLLLCMVPIWQLFALRPWTVVAIAGEGAVFIPFFRKQKLESCHQSERLREVSQYMDTMLYAFQKEGKIYNAIGDVYNALMDGELRQQVGRVKDYMELTYDEGDVMRKGLEQIYERYPARRIRNLHEFILHVEYFGGNISGPVDLFMKEKEMWELRMKQMLGQREKMFRDVILSVVASLGICSVVRFLPVTNVNVAEHPVSQILTILVFTLDGLILLKGQRYLCVDWVAMEEKEGNLSYKDKLEEYKNWDAKKEGRLSICLGTVMSAITIFCFYRNSFWLGCLGMGLSVFLFRQHELGHKLLGRKLEKELCRAFPIWLMDLVLLLQTENVQNALVKSQEQAPAILEAELDLLLSKLEMNPESPEPYHDFFKDFDVPEIRSAMSLLYAMSMGYGGSLDQQIGNLIRRNQEMQNIAEKHQDEERTSGLYLLFLAPVMTGAGKLLVDMALFMLSFLTVSLQ